MRNFPCTTKNDIILRRNAPLSIEFLYGFVYPLFSWVIERAGGHFCPCVLIVDYPNVSALLSKKAMKVPQIRYVWYLIWAFSSDSKRWLMGDLV